jgi:hypothetical protein
MGNFEDFQNSLQENLHNLNIHQNHKDLQLLDIHQHLHTNLLGL